MIIESLELKDYRNYENLDIKLSSGVNIFYGDNAQGKTNILESIYLATTSKSHRGSKDKDIIRFGAGESHIKLMIKKMDASVRLDMHIKKNKAKGVAINGIPIRKLSELFGTCNVVFFSPEDLNIIKRSPKERRNFVDMELCQLNKVYVSALVTYNKVLDQRNKLLKEIGFKSGLEDTLDIWDMQLVKYGKDLIAYREAFIKELNDRLRVNKEEVGISLEELDRGLQQGEDNESSDTNSEREAVQVSGGDGNNKGRKTGDDAIKFNLDGQEVTMSKTDVEKDKEMSKGAFLKSYDVNDNNEEYVEYKEN